MTNSLVLLGHMDNYQPDLKPPTPTLKGIKSFNAFEFEGPGKIRVWKQSGIGPGRLITSVNPILSESTFECRVVTKYGIHEDVKESMDEKWLKPQKMVPKPVKQDHNNDPIVLGQNTQNEETVPTRNESMMEEMRRRYFSEFSIGATSRSVKVRTHLQALAEVPIPPQLETGNQPNYPKGYALMQYSTTSPMKPSEKAFLLDFFNEGQRTKKKLSGAAGATLALDKLRQDPSFSPPYPKVRQIQTYFTQCYRNVKNQTISADGIAIVPNDANLDGEATPEEEEDVRLIEATTAQNEVISAMEQLAQDDDGSNDTHPLEENNIDLCGIAVDYMAKKGKPGKLYIDNYEKDEIKVVMEKLDIPLPKKMTGRLMARAIFNYVATECPDQCTTQL